MLAQARSPAQDAGDAGEGRGMAGKAKQAIMVEHDGCHELSGYSRGE